MVDPGTPDTQAADKPAVGDTPNLFEIAAGRDTAAETRDRLAEGRDEAATVRDTAADHRDRVADLSVNRTESDATAGERSVASDRAMSGRDRECALDDRAEAAHDRWSASADRGASADDRAAAGIDELTGAHRRGAGFADLRREMARARRTGQGLVVAFVDVDGLKAINDSRGHGAGDRLLREVVAVLRNNLRSYDLIIRLGGDEFLCAIPGVSPAEAAQRLTAVNPMLAASIGYGSISTGIASMLTGDSLQDVIDRADGALYRHRRHLPVVDLTHPEHVEAARRPAR